MITNKYLYDISSFYIDLAIKAIWWKNYIPSQEWEDIKECIIIHIFNKKIKYNKSKPIKPWVKTIVGNQLKNLIRNGFANNIKTKEKRYDFYSHIPILTKIKQNSISGYEEIVYEPDIVIKKENEIDLNEFKNSLTKMENKLVDAINITNTISNAARKLHWNRQTTQARISNIRKKAKNFINKY